MVSIENTFEQLVKFNDSDKKYLCRYLCTGRRKNNETIEIAYFKHRSFMQISIGKNNYNLNVSTYNGKIVITIYKNGMYYGHKEINDFINHIRGIRIKHILAEQ